ncbi:hypothetical protein ACIPLC_36160 [Kitasatospora sp. NPDC086801]|uniref:hypothetical protein n=1 Tax=Kitasatospora sp. NPDC086801 TaxID=3364066 RepID=UPI0037F1B6AC
MTPPARRPLSLPTGPSASPASSAPVRPAWPLLHAQPLPADDDEDQAVAEPAAPTARRRLWSGPRD